MPWGLIVLLWCATNWVASWNNNFSYNQFLSYIGKTLPSLLSDFRTPYCPNLQKVEDNFFLIFDLDSMCNSSFNFSDAKMKRKTSMTIYEAKLEKKILRKKFIGIINDLLRFLSFCNLKARQEQFN